MGDGFPGQPGKPSRHEGSFPREVPGNLVRSSLGTDRDALLDFTESPVPAGADPWVDGARPGTDLTLTNHDPRWADDYAVLEALVTRALGSMLLRIDHVGSTAVPDLVAKPIIDVCVIVPDPDDEASYVPALRTSGCVLTVREPWWQRHRMFRHPEPRANIHVFGPDAVEPERQRIFRDWLREHPRDRRRYERAKRGAAELGGHVMEYNARKQQVLREILVRAVNAAG